jgi:hypothetical protein
MSKVRNNCNKFSILDPHNAIKLSKQCFNCKRWQLTSSELNESSDHDDEESQQFGVGEDVLHESCPFHLPTIDESQHTCNQAKKIV